jgi:putative endonuclease
MGYGNGQHAAPSGERQRLGASGERLAASWLEARGYRILDRNWRCPSGELDLVAELADELVVVEVKTRRGSAMGAPEEAITPAKRRHLIASTQEYLLAHAMEQRPYRIDVVAIELAPGGRLLGIRHLPACVELEG